MPTITDQPTEPHDAFSQDTVDEGRTAFADPTVQGAIADPSYKNLVAAYEDPEVQALLHQVPDVYKETKAGYKTTEFWLTIAGLLAVNLNGVILTLPDKYQALASAALTGLYVVSRGVAKKGIPAVEPGVPEA